MYEDKTPEQIKADIIAALNPDREILWETREGSFADDQSGPMALEMSKVYDSLNEVQFIVWVDETSGPYLDMAAEDLGLEPRKQGTKARASLQILATAGFLIPKGKYFVSTENLNFIALEDVVIPSDNLVVINVEAENIGSSYNVAADTITQQFSNDAEITVVTNPEPSMGGTDPESDKSLFARFDFARKKPRTSANKYDYEDWALEVSGIGAVRVFPLYYGRGSVMVLIADDNRRPVDSAVIDDCSKHIEERMTCGGIELTVKTPQESFVDISVQIKTDGSVTLDAVRKAFKDAVASHFSDIALIQNQIVYHKICSLLIEIDGVADHSNLLLNGKAENVILSGEQVPVLREVEVI